MVPALKDNLIALGLTVAMLAVAFIGFQKPSLRKLDEIQTRIVTEKASLESSGEQVAAIPGVARQIEAMKSKYRDFDRRLPKRKELGGFLRELSGHLSDSNLSNQTIEPGNPTPGELFYTLPIVMRFHGSYLALAGFLDQIEHMERITKVQRLSIVTDPRDSLLEIVLNMNIYFTES